MSSSDEHNSNLAATPAETCTGNVIELSFALLARTCSARRDDGVSFSVKDGRYPCIPWVDCDF